MEPNTPQAERLLSFTATCRRAAQGLYWLLREIELHPERAAALAKRRHLFATQTAPDPEAVEVIDHQHHRAHLHQIHPMALPEGDPARREPLVCVGAFDPLAHLLGMPEAEGPAPLDLVFTGAPPNLVFVEAERPAGHGVDVGEWLTRADGYTVLRLHAAE